MNNSATGRLARLLDFAAIATFALFSLLVSGGALNAQFAGGGGTTGIALESADWVPARDPDYGGWGVVGAGQPIAKPVQWTKDAPSLAVPPGSYDVYWVQDYDTRDTPLLIASGVKVEADQLTTVKADSGIKIVVASWVPPRDKDYGWWGAAKAGDPPDKLVNWSKSAEALLLPPGTYDFYWAQDYDTRGKPIPVAAGVTIAAGSAETLNVDFGAKIEVAGWVPPRDKDYGWWGAAKAGEGPEKLVNWSKTAEALVLPPGAYDFFWVQDYDTHNTPILIGSGLKVAAGAVTRLVANSGMRIDVAGWVPPRDKDYGWWGAAKAGDPPDKRVNWSKSATALLLPPGRYDVYWVQSYAAHDKPLFIASGVPVSPGEFSGVGLEVAMVDGLVEVVDAFTDGPAASAGLKAGDTIVDIGGKPVLGLTLTEAVDLLRGPVGSTVALKVRHGKAAAPIDVTVERKVVIREPATVRVETGIRPVVAADLLPLDKDSGWWGAVRAWDRPNNLVNLSAGQSADPLVLPPGRYDIYWRPDSSSDPQLKAERVEVKPGALVDVPIGVASLVPKPSFVTDFKIASTGGEEFVNGVLPQGVKEVVARYAWKNADIGHRFGVRWYKDDQMVLEQGEPVATAEGETKWTLKTQDGGPLPLGLYRVELMENGDLRAPLDFAIAAARSSDAGTTAPPTIEPAPASAASGGTGGEWALVQVVTQGPPFAIDDFSDPKSGWTVEERGARHLGYVDQTFRITLDATGDGWVFATNGKEVADAILQIDAGDTPASASHPYGIIVRAKDGANFHAFVTASDESYAAFHVENGKFGMDGTPDRKLPPGVFRHDGPNRIQAFLHGDRIVYFVNGREIDHATALWPAGLGGVISANVKQGKSEVVFDDWKVWTAGPEAASAATPQ